MEFLRSEDCCRWKGISQWWILLPAHQPISEINLINERQWDLHSDRQKDKKVWQINSLNRDETSDLAVVGLHQLGLGKNLMQIKRFCRLFRTESNWSWWKDRCRKEPKSLVPLPISRTSHIDRDLTKWFAEIWREMLMYGGIVLNRNQLIARRFHQIWRFVEGQSENESLITELTCQLWRSSVKQQKSIQREYELSEKKTNLYFSSLTTLINRWLLNNIRRTTDTDFPTGLSQRVFLKGLWSWSSKYFIYHQIFFIFDYKWFSFSVLNLWNRSLNKNKNETFQ